MKKAKLELTWIGKEDRSHLEPRILLAESGKSFYKSIPNSVSNNYHNSLIYGDNLLALKALQHEYAGKVKCVFIDPPYNTGSAFDHYDDGVEHSIWLNLMRDRLEHLSSLLAVDGSIWIAIDDNEAHYLKVMCDEIFGRSNFIGTIVWQHSVQSKNDAKLISLHHNYILAYRKSEAFQRNLLARSEKHNVNYSNSDNDPRGPWRSGDVRSPNYRENLCYTVTTPSGKKIPPPAKGWRWSKETFQEKVDSGEIVFLENETRVLRKIYLSEQDGRVPESIWLGDEVGTTREASAEVGALVPREAGVFATPKPERLISRILEIATKPGDLVLDSFAGSGTTGAVAHKMGRQWIMIELGEHCHTHIIPRLKKVISGEDVGGISQSVQWNGGGGFHYYRLAPSLLEQDSWGNWIISREFNSTMLAEAICKLNGFTFAPSDSIFWKHGHSTERDFIYVTTQTLTREQLAKISEEVGESKSLLICCGAFRVNADSFSNLTLKKIPKAVLNKCEWGRDDYSLKVNELPIEELQTQPEPVSKSHGARSKKERRATTTQGQLGLFERGK